MKLSIIKRSVDLAAVTAELEATGDASLTSRFRASPGDTIILVELGPEQTPARIYIRRSAWPTCTTLNHGHDRGREFHLRLRQHIRTGVYLVYGSVELPGGMIRQRGHLCRTLEEVKDVMPLLRAELEIPTKKAIPP